MLCVYSIWEPRVLHYYILDLRQGFCVNDYMWIDLSKITWSFL